LYRKENRFNSPTCAYIELDNGVIFIDSGSDEFIKIRGYKRQFAQFLTHFHGDHAYGLLRLRHSAEDIPCYHPKDDKGFADILKRPHGFKFCENRPFEILHIRGLEFTPIPLIHSRPTHGYMIKSPNKKIAYLTDCSALPDETLEFLQRHNPNAVFIDASYDTNYNEGKHLDFKKASDIIDRIGSSEGFLIHQSHYSLSYVINHKLKLKYPYIYENFEYEL
jgi:phosphoribosyl 1,2-cyclic phosphate phosphodiesterase